ncbi:MAG: hypothetical protein ACRDTE_21405 [Pseudonocardiaceae bacterium]
MFGAGPAMTMIRRQPQVIRRSHSTRRPNERSQNYYHSKHDLDGLASESRSSVALREVGPISLTVCAEPIFTWTSKELDKGRRLATIHGIATAIEAEQLQELFANPDIRQAVGGAFGVLETMWFDDSDLNHLSGSYLLQSFDEIGAPPQGNGEGHVRFKLRVLYLGPDPELVTVYTPRQLSNA